MVAKQLSIFLENKSGRLPEVTVDEAVAEEAVKPIKKMLEISEKLGL